MGHAHNRSSMTEQLILCWYLFRLLRCAEVIYELENFCPVVFFFYPDCFQVIVVEGEEDGQIDL